MQIDYSRFDHIDTSDSEAGDPTAPSQLPLASDRPPGPPANVLDDLEDYFHRLDARRSELEAGLNAGSDEESTPVPSVERFDDADFAELLRSRTDSNAECAICLADLSPDEEALELPCAARHTFHEECARSWLSRNVTCPLCRVDVRGIVRRRGGQSQASGPPAANESQDSPRAFGYTRDGGVILRYDPRPPPELPRPLYIPFDLHHAAELVEIQYPDRGTARVWRVPRNQ
ncbi:rnf111 [Symbiodinium natans]|uniref:Rnf111 protein n=1 Tax=Symbiodinium natans TaxID=878477 RepID=A0A812J6J0_9DINO|nr:rnf111 [Symbiodinium natans]